MQFLIWNKKENRPANVKELNRLINGDGDDNNKQIFMSWSAFPSETDLDEGIVNIDIDSGAEEDFCIVKQ